MPILDTVVLFGAADPSDKAHRESIRYLHLLEEDPTLFLGGFALLEFDIVMKSRGFDPEERMTKHALLANDFPTLKTKTRSLSPQIFYLTAKLEKEGGVDYFDAGLGAEAILHDGRIVSRDPVFDKLSGITRLW